MKIDDQTPLLQSRRDIVLLILLCFFAFYFGLGSRSLFTQDVVRYAEIAREMIHFDSWLIPRFNGDVYAKKPAPYVWLIAVPSALVGEVNEWTARLPSAFAGLGTVIFTYLLGKSIAGRNAGMYSALSLVACYKFNLLARTSRTDMPFTFFVIAAVYFFWAGFKTPSRRSRYCVLGFVMVSLSILMKGPAGFVIVLVTLLGYTILKRDWSLLKSWSLLWGFIVFVGIIALWLIPTCIVGGAEFAEDFVVRQNLGRFYGDIDHVEPFYYYFYRLPLEIAPLNLLIPVCIAFYLSRRKRRKRDILYVLVFFIVTFLLFQMSRSRNIRYLLPLYPVIAIFFGIFWDDFEKKSAVTKGLLRIVIVVAVLLYVCVLLGMPIFAGIEELEYGFGISLSALMVVMLVWVLSKWGMQSVRTCFALFIGASIVAYVFLIVEMDDIEGVPEQVMFANKLKEASSGEDLYLYKYYRLEYGHSRPAEFFYYGKYTPPLDTEEELEEIRASNPEKGIYLLTLRDVFEKEHLEGDVFLDENYMGEDVVLVRIGPK